MATMTETYTMPTRSKTKAGKIELTPESQRFMLACQDVANALVQDYESTRDADGPKKDINLNSLRGQISRKYKLSQQPPLTAILASVPEQYKKYLLPKLIAKPVRSASGICVVSLLTSHSMSMNNNSTGCCHVQTT